ncbi:MAG TPA: hypothetical protein VE988_19870 [Gemmataceae bacterium]|nr:hypothetical protein [Gemmataceae bacterium]
MMVTVSELGLSPRVILADRFGDGTIWWLMEDEQQNRALVCLDGRRGSPTQFRLLDGTRRSTEPGGKVLELGSSEEGIAVSLLSQWLDEQHPRDVASEYTFEVIRAALLRLGDSAESVAAAAGGRDVGS